MLDTTRREFIALVGGGGLLLTAKVRRARGSKVAKVPRIGILDDAPMWQAFRQALRTSDTSKGRTSPMNTATVRGRPSSFAVRWT